MDYFYSVGNNKVVCITHYRGKSIRGIAKCDTEYDLFDPEVGMKLAKLRCDLKVAEKKMHDREDSKLAAEKALKTAEAHYVSTTRRHQVAVNNYNDSLRELIEFENKLINL